ncbi:extracellular solute-binding protein [Mesorhizobium calcicola]|uniref:Extracellular solute-binding protein n=1 Tax=Mesorhizobium calcicola TaxID=1300310 RepID=A0ABW4WE84_9HYPH
MSIFSRRFFIGAAAATLCSVGLTEANAAEELTLRVSAAPSIVADMYEAMARAFEAKHPKIKIDIDTSQRDYNAQVDATLRDSLTGQLADVSIQGNNKIRLYVDRGLAVPLDDYLSVELKSDETTLSPSVASIGEVGGKVYGLGLSVSAPVIFYNLDLVKKVDVDPSGLPTTWDGILELARKINDPASGTLGAYFTYDQADWFWIALIESQGGRMMTPDEKKVAFDGAQGLKAMQLLKAFGEAGQAEVDMPRDQVRQLFAAGKIAILADSSGSLGGFEKQSEEKFAIATRKFPLLSESARLPAGGGLGIVFAKDPERQKAAWEFLKFAAGADGQKIIAEKSSYLVANSRVATDPAMLGEFYRNKPNMKAAIEELPILNSWYSFPGQNSGKIINTLIDRMRSVITLKAEPEAALKATVQDIQALLPN